MFIVIAHYRCAPDALPALLPLLTGLASCSRQEPGNRGYEVLQDRQDPGHVTLVERYSDESAFEAHLASPHYNNIAVARIRPLLSERSVVLCAPALI